MRNGLLRTALMAMFSCLVCTITAQNIALYVSKQTNKSSQYNGNYAKQTDRYEQGTVTLSPSGPITYNVTPGDFTIQPNQNKNWTGVVSADVNAAPPAGNAMPAQLLANYNIQYSRPYGGGTSGTVLSTYYCSDNGSAAGNGGCAFHNNHPGAHEIVKQTGQHAIDFTVFSINVVLPDTLCLGDTGQKDITALSFPALGGSFMWTTSNPQVQITNANQATANIKLLDTTIKNATVTVKFTIEGVSYEKSAVLSTCECSCKAITTGIDAGPVHLTSNVDPQSPNPDGSGNCQYASNNAGFTLTLDGGAIKRTVNVQNNANVTFGKNCNTGDLSEVKIDWTGEIVVPELEIKGVKTFALTVKEIHVAVATNGNLTGTVKVNVTNTEDRDLSVNKKFVMLRKGTSSDVTFAFNNTNGWAGAWNWSGIQGIKIDLCKQNDGAEVILANYTGNMSADGVLSGDFSVTANPSYKSNLFKVTLQELTLGTELKLTDGSFRLTSGSGKVRISDMKAITGTIDLGLTFPEAGGCTATVSASDIKAFAMTLDEFNLQAEFTREFDMVKVEGSLKAKHNQFDVKINVDQFKIEQGSLTIFKCSGLVKYSAFKFTLSNGSYEAGTPSKISITAKVEMSATGTAAMLAVDKFTIDESGTIAVGGVSGSLNKPPVTASFTATFGNSRFTGTFNADFAGIGLDGAVDIGSKENPDYNFAYLAITAKVNVPLGQSGLKVTQVGGKIGYNYKLTNVAGPGDPEQGKYLAGLKLGVADIGNMCEVTGETIIQFGNGAIDITLAGTVVVLKNNKFFSGNANVTFKIPAQTLAGSLAADLSIPSSGFLFKTKNLTINFNFGNNKFGANGAGMIGTMFNDKIQLTNGSFNLSGDLTNLTAVTGRLAGKASCSFSYSLSQSAFGNSISGTINLNMNSNVDVGFDENGLAGSFDVTVTGDGTLTLDTWISTTTLSASATSSGSVNYSGGTLSMTGNVIVTLPFRIPYWGNQISTGVVSISI